MNYHVLNEPAYILTDVVHSLIQPQPHRPLQLTQLLQHQQLLQQQPMIVVTQSSAKTTYLVRSHPV